MIQSPRWEMGSCLEGWGKRGQPGGRRLGYVEVKNLRGQATLARGCRTWIRSELLSYTGGYNLLGVSRMRMKVHNKGQVVLPAQLRAQLGIEIGDMLDVEVVADEGKIELRRSEEGKAASLAGSLERYARGKPFPSDQQMADALRRGMIHNG